MPTVLVQSGRQRARALKGTFTRNPTAFENGERKFVYASEVYGHNSVRDVLLEAQNSKCCYCEARLGPTMSSGEVEHFRPKGYVQQDENEERLRPGYYWLAYEWDNLLLSCRDCNGKHKRNFFPLADPLTRARSHTADLSAEQPLLINPYLLDPSAHIKFTNDVVQARDQSPTGRASIKFFGLDRRQLRESRFEVLKLAGMIKALSEMGPTDAIRTRAIAQITEMRSPRGQFAGMLNDNGL